VPFTARLKTHNERYCQPRTHFLLSGLVRCGVCGGACSSTRRYHKKRRISGEIALYNNSAYRCDRKAKSFYHEPENRQRCTNSQIGTNVLAGKVLEVVAQVMTDPGKLRGCMSARMKGGAATSAALHRIARKIGALDDERRQLNYRYAANEISSDEFITASRALDAKLGNLASDKTQLAAALRSPEHEDFVDASVRQFCATARVRLQACTTEDDKRSFLLDHVEQVVYDHYDISVMGSVPVQTASGASKLPFRIEGVINIKKVKSQALRKAARKLWCEEMTRHDSAEIGKHAGAE
jgi:hypothetical protein